MKKILITGVGGNVGRYIGDDLADAGYEVVGVYRNKIPMGSNYILIQADLSKHFSGGGGITDVDTVIHVAAALSGSTRTLIRDNIEATKNLVCWAEQTHVKRLIYMSTVSVYGRVKGEVCETSMMNTPNIYAITKRLGESIVKEAEIPEKLIVQLPRMIGPYVSLEHTEDSGFLSMTKRILIGENVNCFIPEQRYNNYLHVSELGGFLKYLLAKEVWKENDTVLLGARDKFTMLHILRTMRDEIKSSSEIIAKENGTTPVCSLINTDKAQRLGFRPYNTEDMLKRFIKEVHIMQMNGMKS